MNERAGWRDVGPQWGAAPQQTIIQLVDEACRQWPDSQAMIFEDGLVVTYADLLAASEHFAGYLAERVQPGEAVAVILRNRAEFMIAWLAVVANRAVLVPVNPDDKILDAGHILRDSAAVIVILTDEHDALIAELRPGLTALREVITVRGGEPRGLAAYSGSRPLLFADPRCAREDISNIYYTSGTTGRPKGCMVDHEWWLRTVDVLLRRIPQTPSDRVLLRRSRPPAARMPDDRRRAGGDAPLQRVPLLGCGARAPGHHDPELRLDPVVPAQGGA